MENNTKQDSERNTLEHSNLEHSNLEHGTLENRNENTLTLKLGLVCATLVILIFFIDLQIPLGVAGGIPYIVVILASLWSPKLHLSIYLALICSIAILLGFYLSPPGGELWKVLSNRALALFAIWITAILSLKWKIYEQEIQHLKTEIEKEKEKVYLATIYGAEHIVNNLLNQLQVVEIEIERHPQFDKGISSMFSGMQEEAALLMKDLSAVKNIDDKAIITSITPKSVG